MFWRVSGTGSHSISATTRYCAVYGQPIHHSASPAMQNAGIDSLGLNWKYLAFDVNPNGLRSAIAGAKAMKFIGLNLTIPHKLLAMDIVDELDETSIRWGAVNTIRFEGKVSDAEWKPLREIADDEPIELIRSRGFNTDADAIVRSLKEDLACNLADSKVLLLGAGGAGRVAALKLAAESVEELYVVNRTVQKAAVIVQEIQKCFPHIKAMVGYPNDPVDLIVNSTSLGLKPSDPMPLDERDFPLKKAGAVYDMIYRPAETKLLSSAKAAGCEISNGLGMLLYQGTKALEIWSGATAPVEVMRLALKTHIYGNV